MSRGLNEHYLAVWLQKAGFNTYYSGKLFNAHTVENCKALYPAGFTDQTLCLIRTHPSTVIARSSVAKMRLVVMKAGTPRTSCLRKPSAFSVTQLRPNAEFNENSFSDLRHSFKVKPPVSAERHKHLFSKVSRSHRQIISIRENDRPPQPGCKADRGKPQRFGTFRQGVVAHSRQVEVRDISFICCATCHYPCYPMF